MNPKQVTLWSWLIKNDAKSEIYSPSNLTVTIEEFAMELEKQAQENQLPARVELCEINWDDTNTKQSRILVQYRGEDTTTKVVQFLVGVDQMGNFFYVEEKIYLSPPVLPPYPRKWKKGWLDDVSEDAGCWIMLLMIITVIPFILYLNNKTEVDQWNDKAKREKEEWDKAWDSWQKEVLEATYLSKINDVFGRFTQAMSSTVQQVVQTLFLDQQAELRERIEQQQTQAEIEKELEKRKAEFK